MAFYRIPLKAGVEHIQYIAGSLILVDGIDGAAGVDVTPILNNSPQVTMPARKAGFKYRTNYDGVALRAAADCVVGIFLTTNDVSLGFTDGAQVNVLGSVQVTNGADSRLPVDLAGGTVNVNATNVGINNTAANPVPVAVQPNDAAPLVTAKRKLTQFVHVAAVLVGTGSGLKVAGDPTLKRIHITNNSKNGEIVGIGGQAVTIDNAAILLYPGDSWTDDDMAGVDWYAVSSIAGADVRVMGAK